MPQLKLNFQIATDFLTIPTRIQTCKWAKAAIRIDTEITIRLVDEAEGRALNLAYRGRDYATNVLTFPLTETPHLMGDIVICAPVVASEAIEQNKTLIAHYAHLTVHGVLHLHGYDHENEHQAALMEGLEISILHKLGYANPYFVS